MTWDAYEHENGAGDGAGDGVGDGRVAVRPVCAA